jgi:hypothetical protein
MIDTDSTARVLGAPTKNDHRTPESVLEIIRAYAPIGLDPCSNPWSTVGARVELSKHRGDDGLAACWSAIIMDQGDTATVYVNPPYGAGLILPWVHKAADEGIETLVLARDSVGSSSADVL